MCIDRVDPMPPRYITINPPGVWVSLKDYDETAAFLKKCRKSISRLVDKNTDLESQNNALKRHAVELRAKVEYHRAACRRAEDRVIQVRREILDWVGTHVIPAFAPGYCKVFIGLTEFITFLNSLGLGNGK